MVENGWLGEKSGQGFYKRVKTEKGKEILVLNPKTLTYEPRQKLKAPSLEASKRAKGLPKKLRALVYADDVAGKLAWTITKKCFFIPLPVWKKSPMTSPVWIVR